jgi:DNA-binding MurR/RpiR family transcriptional regulator
MQGSILTIFGGSGFIASEIVYKLSNLSKKFAYLHVTHKPVIT